MDFLTKHMAYAEQCAQCRAIEIAELTGRFGDVEDFKQEILVALVKAAPNYKASRGRPSTFISMAATSAKRKILRKLRRNKQRIITDAIPLP